MILESIVREYEAIKFDGQNMAEVRKFIGRHAAAIDFQTTPQGTTHGYLQTLDGTVDIVPGIILASGIDDQVFAIHPRDIGEKFPQKYRKVAEEGRLGEWVHDIPPEPVVEDVDVTVGLVTVEDPNHSHETAPNPDSAEARLERLERIILGLAK